MFDFQTTNSATDIVRDCCSMSYIGIRKKHCNLLSAIAGGKVSRTSGCQVPDKMANRSQAVIARCMSVNVVVLLEAIDIHHDQCKSTRVTCGATEFVMQCNIELTAIREPGQIVLHCKSFKGPI